MGALPAVPKAVRLDIHFAMPDDANVQIREFFTYSGALSVTDAATWLSNMSTAMQSFVSATMSNNTALQLMELTDLTSSTAPQVLNSSTAVGGSGVASVPNGTALVIRKHILRRYRGGHPRVYIPAMPNTALTNSNTWSTGALGTVVGDYQTFINACTANTNPAAIGTITHVNISYYSGFVNHTYPSGRVKPIPTPRGTPLVDSVVGIVGNPTVGSQRRRNEQP